MRVHEDWCSEGRARVVLGQVYCLTGQFAEADREAKRALVAGLAAEDPVTQRRRRPMGDHIGQILGM